MHLNVPKSERLAVVSAKTLAYRQAITLDEEQQEEEIITIINLKHENEEKEDFFFFKLMSIKRIK